jgi:D-serine deaminase-like pyridoxal phosphate-dependent protein
MDGLVESAEMVKAAGLPCPIVTAGGTGTFDITGSHPGITEVQAGSYITMDARYRSIGVPFRCALTVLCSVVSRPTPDVLIVDAGKKTITEEFGLPEVVGVPGAKLNSLSEEHGKITLEDPGAVSLRPGDRLELLPTHGDTTINLHERYFALRNGKLEAIWPIPARGRVR